MLGERSAGNRHATFDEAGAGNTALKARAPVLDPTELHASKPDVTSRNLIFYKENTRWNFKEPDFFDNSLSKDFRDNSDNAGKG
ncbi:MAG TPA: hypothetical protein VHA52_03525 [Candidatus Babeliaceae bacterium]|nr:hypothetical protein [Candidatus Babeliaceae bacterium]